MLPKRLTVSPRPDPYWPLASAWMAGEYADQAPAGAPLFAALGLPLSQASTPPNGSHLAPPAIRSALSRFSPFAAGVGLPGEPTNVDLCELLPVDLGDLPLHDLDNVAAQDLIEREIASLQRDERLVRPPDLLLLLGGDDAVFRPALRGLTSDLSQAGLLTLDAHHDVRDYYRNMGPHNGSPVRGLIDDGLSGENVVQIGMSSFGNSRVYREYCDDHGITVIEASRARVEGVAACVARGLDELASRCDLILVDFDLDVIDKAFRCACPGARSGGLAPWEVHQAAVCAGRNPKVRALSLVEVDPSIDRDNIGVENAALCLLHAAAGLCLRGRPRS